MTSLHLVTVTPGQADTIIAWAQTDPSFNAMAAIATTEGHLAGGAVLYGHQIAAVVVHPDITSEHVAERIRRMAIRACIGFNAMLGRETTVATGVLVDPHKYGFAPSLYAAVATPNKNSPEDDQDLEADTQKDAAVTNGSERINSVTPDTKRRKPKARAIRRKPASTNTQGVSLEANVPLDTD